MRVCVRTRLLAIAVIALGCRAAPASSPALSAQGQSEPLNATLYVGVPTPGAGWVPHQVKCLSVSTPESWRVDRTGEYTLAFVAPGQTYVSVALVTCACSMATEPADDVLSCLMGYAARIQAQGENWVNVVSADTWHDGDQSGYLMEYNLRGGDNGDQYQGWLFLPVDDRRAIVACMTKAGAPDVAEAEWQDFLGVTESARLPCR